MDLTKRVWVPVSDRENISAWIHQKLGHAGGVRHRKPVNASNLQIFRPVFQNVAGLAVEVLAYGFERGEADGFGFAGFEDGQVLRSYVHGLGQIVQPHFALGENHVEIDDDGHKLKPSTPVPLADPVLRGKTTQQISKSMPQTIHLHPAGNDKG